MAIRETYKKAYAAQRTAVRDQLAKTKSYLQSEQNTAETNAVNALRSAYAARVRRTNRGAQLDRAAGMFGGAARNHGRGVQTAYSEARQKIKSALQSKRNSIRSRLISAESNAQTKLAAIDAAETQKMQALDKQEAAAQKAAAKAVTGSVKSASAGKSTTKKSSSGSKSSGTKSKSSGTKSVTSSLGTKADVIRLMKMGIYHPDMAKVLGISDDEVQTYVTKVVNKRLNKSDEGKGYDAKGHRVTKTQH